jgi:hypothetical protein
VVLLVFKEPLAQDYKVLKDQQVFKVTLVYKAHKV